MSPAVSGLGCLRPAGLQGWAGSRPGTCSQSASLLRNRHIYLGGDTFIWEGTHFLGGRGDTFILEGEGHIYLGGRGDIFI